MPRDLGRFGQGEDMNEPFDADAETVRLWVGGRPGAVEVGEALQRAYDRGRRAMQKRFLDELEDQAMRRHEMTDFEGRDTIEQVVKHFRLNPIDPETGERP